MNRRQQRHGHAQAQDPPQGREQRHVHVVEDEDLVTQHGQAIEIFGTLLVGHGDDARPAAWLRATQARW